MEQLALYMKYIQTVKIISLTTYFKTKYPTSQNEDSHVQDQLSKFQFNLTVNEAGIFILPIRRNVENWVALTRKQRPTMINSQQPALSANRFVKVSVQRYHVRLNVVSTINNTKLRFLSNLDLFHYSNWYFCYGQWSKRVLNYSRLHQLDS